MRRPLITPVLLSEMYVQPGIYPTNFLLDPRRSQETEIVEVMMTDSDGHRMVTEFKRWGTKLHVTFEVSASTPDGVALLDFVLSGGSRERFKAWIVK